jgi:REP element-mobilizing transposase RayT
MERFGHKRLDHQPADWLRDEPEYFVTVCADPRGKNHFCHPEIGPVILESVKYRNQKQVWYCSLVLLMPDHIHLLISFPNLPSFSPVIGSWKHWLSHQHGISWQDNFFDHRIRETEHSGDKAEYILQNPVRAGLVAKAEDWPYRWIAER